MRYRSLQPDLTCENVQAGLPAVPALGEGWASQVAGQCRQQRPGQQAENEAAGGHGFVGVGHPTAFGVCGTFQRASRVEPPHGCHAPDF